MFIGTIHVRDALDEDHLVSLEKDEERKTMIRKTVTRRREILREEIHVFVHDLMVRMQNICLNIRISLQLSYDKWLRILSNNTILVQRTCADKISAIRFWGGVGGAKLRTRRPHSPPRDDVLRSTDVL